MAFVYDDSLLLGYSLCPYASDLSDLSGGIVNVAVAMVAASEPDEHRNGWPRE